MSGDIIKLANLIKEEISPFCSRAEIVGSIRRKEKKIKDIDIVCIPNNLEEIIKYISDYIKDNNFKRIRGGLKLISFNTGLCNVDIYFATEDNWGAMLLTFTGSGKYNIGLRRLAKSKGLKLNQYGIWLENKCLASKTEEAIYRLLNKEWKLPELRGK